MALTIEIERKIDNYLSTYFCSSLKKKNQLNELLFFTERVTLDMKRQIFSVLLKSYQSIYLKENPIFLTHLEKIVPHRNVFAHLEVIDMRDLPIEDKRKLVFKKYTNGEMKPKKYDILEIVDLQVQLQYVSVSLDIIIQELPALE